MPSNLAIDDKLLAEALRVGGLKTKKDTVNAALEEYIARRRRRQALEAFGTIEMAEDYDYKKARRRR